VTLVALDTIIVLAYLLTYFYCQMLLCVPSFPEFLQFLTCICVSVGGSRAQTERGSAEVRQVQGGDRDVDGLDEEDERDARGTETDVD